MHTRVGKFVHFGLKLNMAATMANANRTALSRQIALDHILRRLIQQNPRQSASVQLWNSIARLIPGVTVQHVRRRAWGI